MVMTRREFLTASAGVMSVGGVLRGRPGCILLDLKGGCLRESVAGYVSALHPRVRIAEWHSLSPCAVLIVPGTLDISPAAARAIAACTHAGATVILECGAGFTDERAFGAQRAALLDCLQLKIEPPVQLWPRRTPYIDYSWPYSVKLRDFSRVVPLGAQTGEMIAWVDDLPIAIKRRRGRGTLIFLGSPIGPALWAHDAQARSWLAAVLATA